MNIRAGGGAWGARVARASVAKFENGHLSDSFVHFPLISFLSFKGKVSSGHFRDIKIAPFAWPGHSAPPKKEGHKVGTSKYKTNEEVVD